MADREIDFGPKNTDNILIAGDWNKNGKDGIGVITNTERKIYLKNELDSGVADHVINLRNIEAINAFFLNGKKDTLYIAAMFKNPKKGTYLYLYPVALSSLNPGSAFTLMGEDPSNISANGDIKNPQDGIIRIKLSKLRGIRVAKKLSVAPISADPAQIEFNCSKYTAPISSNIAEARLGNRPNGAALGTLFDQAISVAFTTHDMRR